MNVSEYKYPSFWLNIRKDFNKKHEDAKKELKSINEGKYIPKIVQDGEMELEEYVDKLKKRIVKTNKINNKLKCPMNYLCELKLSKQPNGSSTLPMDYFFNKYELETNRRQSKKVEELIEKYSLDLYNDFMEDNKEYTDYGYCNDNSLLLRDDFDNLIEDIKKVYISLGRKEALTKNSERAAVEVNTVRLVNILEKKCETVFEMNEGGHFTDIVKRVEKAITALT